MAVKDGKTRKAYDLIVIGAEEAGLAAAACVARAGARVALVRRAGEHSASASAPGVPDFVWRRLDLQETGIDAVPAGAAVSLFRDGKELATYRERERTATALADQAAPGHHLWADFHDSLESMAREEGDLVARSVVSAARQAAGPLLGAVTGPDGAGALARLTAAARSVIEDYFDDEAMRAHLSNIALSPLGLAGDEAGSALALASLGEPAAWRIRVGGRGPSLLSALEERCAVAGVEVFESKILRIEGADDKTRHVVLENGETLRARRLMAASVRAAAEAGVPLTPSLSPLTRRSGAVADIRLRFSSPPPPPTDHPDAIYYLSDGPEALAEARDAALEGRFVERPPVSFEFAGGDIIVHAPYCPDALVTEGESREWTEQDRQAFGRQIVSRLAPYLNGAGRALRRIDVRVTPAGARQGSDPSASAVAPPPSHDPIGAAARLAMDLVRDG